MERQQQQQVNLKVQFVFSLFLKTLSNTSTFFNTSITLFYKSNTSRDRSNSWQYLSFDRGALAENQSDDRFAVTTSPKITHRTHWESARRNAERFGERTVSILSIFLHTLYYLFFKSTFFFVLTFKNIFNRAW